ncbi:MAG: hypothetical protein H7Y36_07590, partial [Armatimonadetes bacterium]|nr:hypothetical protein [Akkermansiaceae bacterium]
MSAIVVNLLNRWGVVVTVVRTEDLLQVSAKPIQTSPLSRLPFQVDALESFDIAVVQFGDHWPFHARALEFLNAAPCIAVLHDATMLNFFLGKAHFSGGRVAVQKLCEEGLRVYGPVPNAIEVPTSAHYRWAGPAAEHWPFLHGIASKADALVVHSNHLLTVLPDAFREKIRVLMLPACPTPHKRPPRSR